MKEHFNEVVAKSEQMREQQKKKAADINGLLSRALELRLAAKKALASHRAVWSATILSLRKRE